jgi:tetratricopeptide (TPR) repeat protein
MSGSVLRFFGLCALLVAALASTGCNEIRGRRKIQEGNKLFRDGEYKLAIQKFTEAEALLPNFYVLWLNKGFTCRQILVPGAKTPENIAAADCALASFKRLQELRPQDPKGEVYYFQTLFDADRFEELAKIYEARYQKNPRDIDAVTGLIQVYSKWQKLDEALEWYIKKAEIQANDAEAQYSVGVYIWQQLMQKGGGPDKSSFDPRPDPNKPRIIKVPPPFNMGDIVGQQRVDLADKGIEFLQKAVAIRPKYFESMVYVNLLFRQRAIAFLDAPEDWQKAIDKALEWQRKSLEAQGKPVPANLKALTSEGDKGDEAAAEEAPVVHKKGKKKAAPHKRKRGKK